MLITIFQNIPVVSHRVIAENTQNEQRSIRLLIDKHIADFEEFGKVSFEMTAIKNAKNKVNETKIFYLNEQQATLLMTYLKNTEVVRNFKKALVKAFFELRDRDHNEIILAQNTTIAMLQKELTALKAAPKQIEHKKSCEKCKEYRRRIDDLRFENGRLEESREVIERAEAQFRKWAQMLKDEFTAKADLINLHLHGEKKEIKHMYYGAGFMMNKTETIEGIHNDIATEYNLQRGASK